MSVVLQVAMAVMMEVVVRVILKVMNGGGSGGGSGDVCSRLEETSRAVPKDIWHLLPFRLKEYFLY